MIIVDPTEKLLSLVLIFGFRTSSCGFALFEVWFIKSGSGLPRVKHDLPPQPLTLLQRVFIREIYTNLQVGVTPCVA